MLKERKQVYEPPRILREIPLTSHSCILAGSIIDNKGTIETASQETEEIKDGEDNFEYSW